MKAASIIIGSAALGLGVAWTGWHMLAGMGATGLACALAVLLAVGAVLAAEAEEPAEADADPAEGEEGGKR